MPSRDELAAAWRWLERSTGEVGGAHDVDFMTGEPIIIMTRGDALHTIAAYVREQHEVLQAAQPYANQNPLLAERVRAVLEKFPQEETHDTPT